MTPRESCASKMTLPTLTAMYDYRGDFVLQVARGEPGDEPRWLAEMASLAAQWLRGRDLNNKKRELS